MGTVRLTDVPSARDPEKQAVTRIEQMLRDVGAKSVDATNSSVQFTSYVFQPGSNWHSVVPFEGQLTLAAADGELAVHYRLSSIKMMMVIAVMVSGLLLVSVAMGKDIYPGFWANFAIGWGWLFTGNYIWGAIRFPKWLREGLVEAEAAGALAN